jgi:hypothetical protein
MCYVLFCKQCRFNAEASDLRTFGSQLNIHAASCCAEPVVVLVGEQAEGDRGAGDCGKANTAAKQDASQVLPYVSASR